MAKFREFFTKIFGGGGGEKAYGGTWSVVSGGTNIYNNRSKADLELAYRGWAYACIHAKAEKVGSVEFSISRNGENLEQHPLLDLLYRVNDSQTKYDLVYSVSAHLDIFGRAYVRIARDGKNMSLHILQPDNVTVIYGLGKGNVETVIGYDVQESTAGGRQLRYRLTLDEVIPFADPYPFSKGGFYSVMQAAFDWLEGDIYASLWNKNFFKNSATPDGWITTTMPLGEEQQRRLLESLNQKYRGPQNVGKIGLLPHGTDYKTAGVSQRDMDFAQLDIRYQDKILAIFRTPKSILGITNDVNRANAEASNYIYAANVIEPRMSRIVDSLNEFLAPQFGEGLEVGFVSPIPDDQTEKIAKVQSGLAGQSYMTINEARATMGLSPIDNGDVVVSGGVEVGEPQQLAVYQREKPKRKTAESDRFSEAATKIATVFLGVMEDDQHEKFVRRNLQLVKKMADKLEEYNFAAEKTYNDQFDGLLKNPEALVGKKDVATSESEALQAVIDIAYPFLEAAAVAEAAKGWADLGIAGQYVLSDALLATIGEKTNMLASSYTATMREEVYNVIVDGLASGKTPDEIRSEMNMRVFGGRNATRAEMVADTEIFRAANQGTLAAYRESGIVKTLRWATRKDERVCVFCGPMDGKVISVDSEFYPRGATITAEDGSILKLDYDSVSAGSLHPRCRCWIAADKIDIAD
jgi:HK97 family phage portal protein